MGKERVVSQYLNRIFWLDQPRLMRGTEEGKLPFRGPFGPVVELVCGYIYMFVQICKTCDFAYLYTLYINLYLIYKYVYLYISLYISISLK